MKNKAQRGKDPLHSPLEPTKLVPTPLNWLDGPALYYGEWREGTASTRKDKPAGNQGHHQCLFGGEIPGQAKTPHVKNENSSGIKKWGLF